MSTLHEDFNGQKPQSVLEDTADILFGSAVALNERLPHSSNTRPALLGFVQAIAGTETLKPLGLDQDLRLIADFFARRHTTTHSDSFFSDAIDQFRPNQSDVVADLARTTKQHPTDTANPSMNELARILNTLSNISLGQDPNIDEPLSKQKEAYQIEPEVQKAIAREQRRLDEIERRKQDARTAAESEIIKALFSNTESTGWSNQSTNTLGWVKNDLDGGKELYNAVSRVTDTLTTLSYLKRSGRTMKQSADVVIRMLSPHEPRPEPRV